MASTTAIAYVGLGSNLGDRAGLIATAIERLRQLGDVTAVSSLVETAAVGGPAGSPPFLNAVAAVRTTRPAEDVLRVLLGIEADLGRVRTVRWGPRTIDLDLLLYGDRVVDLPQLTVPHPRLHQRAFVLGPLAEIAPGIVHPTLNVSVVTLLGQLAAKTA